MKNLVFVLLSTLLLCSNNPLFSQGANWITASQDQSATNTWIAFRKDFVVDAIPDMLPTKIAADSKYWMWINGELVIYEGAVKRGPNPSDTYYDSIDLAPFLQQGNNTIAILLWYLGKQGFSHNTSGQSALFFEAKSDVFSLFSDQTWKGVVHPAFFTPSGDVPNFRLSESNIGYDARKEIGNWYQSQYKFDYQNVRILGCEGDAPWNKLHHRVIPQFKNLGYKNYLSVKRQKGELRDTLVCQLPYNAHVHPYFKVTAAENDVIDMYTDHYRGGGTTNVRGLYVAKDGIQEYENLGWMNGHKVYYVIPSGLTSIEVKYRETRYDTEMVGSFECNDPFLNKYWHKAQRTLMVTMRDTYMDCPDRERSQWWGDEVNESGETFYALDAKSHLLTKKGIHELIAWQKKDGVLFSPVPSSNWGKELQAQMLASIGYYGFWNYYLHTGDIQTIKDVYDGALRYLNIWDHNADGTVKVRKTGWIWGDWGTDIDKEVLMNAWYYIAVKGMKNMAKAIGRSQDEMSFQTFLDKFKKSFNSRFWKGKYYKSDNYQMNVDDRVQALAVVSGLAAPEKYADIYKVLKTNEFASPYMEKYVTEALFVMDKEEYGLERMKHRFKKMVEDKNSTTLYEGWGIGKEGFGGGSRNHAWSGGGLTILSQYVCGVLPLQPGYSSFEIKPVKAGLTYAKCSMECIKGIIKVAWKDSSKSFNLSVTIPKETNSLVYLPRDGVKKVMCNDKMLWTKDKHSDTSAITFMNADKNYICFMVKNGSYSFAALK